MYRYLLCPKENYYSILKKLKFEELFEFVKKSKEKLIDVLEKKIFSSKKKELTLRINKINYQ